MKSMLMKVLVAVSTALLGQIVAAGSIPYHDSRADNQAIIFAPGVVNTDAFEINTVFNKAGDEVIFARCNNDFTQCVMKESKFVKGAWQAPKTLPFSGQFHEGDPFYSADFNSLYYISRRPTVKGGEVESSFNFWKVNRTQTGWSEPEYLAGLSSDAHDLYPTLTNDDTLYFPSFRNDERHMYKASKTENGFSKPEKLPAHIYGKNGKVGDSTITRDGKTLILSISARDDSAGRGDLYISRKVKGKWQTAVSLGKKVNTEDHEFTPILSPDEKYLFFTRIENKVGNLYQIKLSAILEN